MGKGFRATDGLLGHNLADILETSLRSRGIHVRIDAIVNDSAASFLSDCYRDSTSSLSVLLGTGLNAAMLLSRQVLPDSKAAHLHQSSSGPRQVLINTELSMFGGDVLMTCPWDELLNMTSACPDFQPYEHRTSGRYLGEIVRLILMTAIKKHGLFAGAVPASFGCYQMQTSTLAVIEQDTSTDLAEARHCLAEHHPLPNGAHFDAQDLGHVQEIVKLVTDRATALIAAAIFALLCLKHTLDPEHAPESSACISCSGSVLESYPSFIDRVQHWLDRLIHREARSTTINSPWRRMKLQPSSETEAALVGAAVAAAAGAQTRHANKHHPFTKQVRLHTQNRDKKQKHQRS